MYRCDRLLQKWNTRHIQKIGHPLEYSRSMEYRLHNWKPSRAKAFLKDPGNLGSLTRSCVCFNWGPILLLPNCCDPFNEKVLRAARGATFKVPLLHTKPTELPHILSKNNLLSVAATSHAEGKSVREDSKDK